MFPAEEGGWKTVKIKIPDDWVRPVAIAAVLFHNYGDQRSKTDATVGVADLTVQTDLAAADPVTGRYLAWKPDAKIKGGGEKNS